MHSLEKSDAYVNDQLNIYICITYTIYVHIYKYVADD